MLARQMMGFAIVKSFSLLFLFVLLSVCSLCSCGKVITQGPCQGADELPSDLFDKGLERVPVREGRAPRDDGSVDVWGGNFGVDLERGGVEKVIKFNATVDSIIKVSCKTERGVSGVITPYIRAAEERKISGGGTQQTLTPFRVIRGTEPGVLIVPFLPAQGGSGDIVLGFEGEGKGGCMRFEMHVAVAPLTAVRRILECPAAIPQPSMPPSAVRVDAGGTGEYHSYGDEYIATPSEMKTVGTEAVLHHEILIQINVPKVSLRTSVFFDWAATDMHLVLFKESSEGGGSAARIEVGHSNETSGVDRAGFQPSFAIESSLAAQLDQGTYILMIQDAVFADITQRVDKRQGHTTDVGVGGACLRFGMSIDLVDISTTEISPETNKAVSVAPRLLSVEPPGADKISPGADLVVILTFSAALGQLSDGRIIIPILKDHVECAEEGAQREFLCEKGLFLYREGDEGEDQGAVPPTRIEMLTSDSLRVTFPSDRMQAGLEYILHIQEAFFRDKKGRDFDVSAHVRAHTYKVLVCSCSGRGSCDAMGACVCDDGYSGDTCQGCAEGYREDLTEDGLLCARSQESAEAAAPEAGCNQYSCSGHGACLLPSYARKAPVCLCHQGYADGDNGMCASCAEGYRGYPDCVRETEAQERDQDARCTLPLLPDTLEAYGGGPAHLQGIYFLDKTRKRHVMGVPISEESLIRVQVDTGVLGLRARAAVEARLGSAGAWQLVQQGNAQGSLACLVKGTHDGHMHFRIVIAYEFVGGGEDGGDCPSVYLQAAAYPMDYVKHIASLVDKQCPAQMPLPTMPTTLQLSAGSFESRSALVASSAGQQALLRGSAVHRMDIVVPEVPGKIARVAVRAGFKFILSQFSVMLHVKDAAGACDYHKDWKDADVSEERGGEWSNELAQGAEGEEVIQDLERVEEKERERAEGGEGGKSSDSGQVPWEGGKEAGSGGKDTEDDDLFEGDTWDQLFKQLEGERGPFGKLGGLGGLGKFFGAGGKSDEDDYDNLDQDDDEDGDDGLWDDDDDDLWGDDNDTGGYEDIDDDWDDDDEDDDFKGLDDWNPFSALMRPADPYYKADPYGPATGVPQQSTRDGGRMWGKRRLLETAEASSSSPSQGGRRLLETREDLRNRCLVGTDTWNQNMIMSELPPGTYTLWVAKAPLLSGKADQTLKDLSSDVPCIPLELSLAVTFDDPPPLESTCTARTLPTRLDEPGYLAAGGKRTHVQGTFAVEQGAQESRRHVIEFRVYSDSIIRVHVQSTAAVDIRLSIFKLDGDQATSQVPTMTPAMSEGVLGDALLGLIHEGNYQLHIEFANPGGVAGIPTSGRGGRSRCLLEMDLELAIEAVEALGAQAGAQCVPDAADKIPSLEDLGGITVGARLFDQPPANIEEAFSSHTQDFFVHVPADKALVGGKGVVAAMYEIKVQEDAFLRAAVWSDFLLDDVSIDLYSAPTGSLVLPGSHKMSMSTMNDVVRPGNYLLKVWLPMSAQAVLRGASTTWERLTNENKEVYYYNKALDKTQWEVPAELSSAWCARFSLAVSLLPVSAQAKCQAEMGAAQLPSSLQVPGKLGHAHKQATLSGLFVLAPTRAPSGPVRQYLRIKVLEKSILRAYASPAAGGSVLTKMTLIGPSWRGGRNVSNALLARSQAWSPANYVDEKGDINLGVLGGVVGDESRQMIKYSLNAGGTYVLRFDHALSDSGTCNVFALQASVSSTLKEEDGSDTGQNFLCDQHDEVWPSIPEDLENGLSSCSADATGAEAAQRCMDDHFGLRFAHGSRPKIRRYPVFVNQDTNVRVELGFEQKAPPLAVSITPTGCTQQPCPKPTGDALSSATVWSRVDGGGAAVLVAPALRKGTYTLAIVEMATNTSARIIKPHCLRYSLRLRTSLPAATERFDGQPSAPQLPSTLDTPAFLEFGGSTHFIGTYAMPSSGASSHDIHLTLSSDTAMRVDAEPQVGHLAAVILDAAQGQPVPTGIMSVDEKTLSVELSLPRSWTRPHLTGTLPAGTYVLRLTFTPDSWTGGTSLVPSKQRGIISLEIALAPEPLSIPTQPKCENSLIPHVTGASLHDDEYHLARTAMTIPGTRLKKVLTIQVVPVSLSQASRVRAVIHSDFLQTPLYLALVSGLGKPTWVCRKLLDGCELDVVVPPGDYSINLWQPLRHDAQDSSCAAYQISMTVVPQGRSLDPKCSTAQTLPPMIPAASMAAEHTSTARYWASPSITMPISQEAESKSAIQVVGGDTLVYAVVMSTAEDVEVSLALLPQKSGVSASIQTIDRGERLASSHHVADGMWKVTCAQQACSVDLVEALMQGSQREPCASYALALFARSQASIDAASACPIKEALPQDDVQVSEQGYAAYEFEGQVRAHAWPPEQESCTNGDCSRSYTHDTNIKAASFSLIEASLEFDPLALSIELYLLSVSPDGTSTNMAQLATWSFSQQHPSPFATLHISAQVERGMHVLRIDRKWSRTQTPMCTPIKWRVAVSPLGQAAGKAQYLPYVWRMSPAGSSVVRPSSALKVRLVLSEGLQDGFSEHSFLLAPKQSSSPSLHATSLEPGEDEEGRPLVTVVFETRGMEADRIYTLRFVPPTSSVARAPTGADSGQSFRQPPPWSFLLPSSPCSSHGSLDEYDLCVCGEGFAGWDCSACLAGDAACEKLQEEETVKQQAPAASGAPASADKTVGGPERAQQSIVDEERQGKVVDLDDEDRGDADEEREDEEHQDDGGRVKIAHPQSQEGDDWVQDNLARKVPASAITVDGAVDVDAVTEEPMMRSPKKPSRVSSSSTESSPQHPQDENKEEGTITGLVSNTGIGWAAAVGVSVVCLCSIVGAFTLLSWRKNSSRRKGSYFALRGNRKSREFEERFRMTAFDEENEL